MNAKTITSTLACAITISAMTHAADKFLMPIKSDSELITAVKKNDISTVRSLLDTNCDVNEKTRYYGSTTLHLAKSAAVVELLIAAKANVNAQDEDGQTPLHIFHDCSSPLTITDSSTEEEIKEARYYALREALSIKRLLITAGADMKARDIRCQCVLEALINKHYVCNSTTMLALYIDMVKLFLARGYEFKKDELGTSNYYDVLASITTSSIYNAVLQAIIDMAGTSKAE